ncbi:MAG: 6-carboxytetrahydropterin synthase [Chthonomonadales bacterium]|nr:6-carboxytetrahydropterin synthase [Chthonomonadales bacterium]
MYTLIVKARFEAAHDIPGHPGKCARLHGHSYRVEAEFAGATLDSLGMVRDFGDLKSALSDVLPDHTYLNDEVPATTTAENISRWVFERLAERGLPVSAITVWETDRCACRYTPDPPAG